MSDIKISADLSNAIETIAAQLGLAANEIVPHYTKLMFVNGITWLIGGFLLSVLPWLMFTVSIPAPEHFSSYDLIETAAGWSTFWMVVRGGVCMITTWIGLYTILDCVENIVAPKALAISKLINQLPE